MNHKLTIYGDSRSGNCLKIKWTADLLEIPYEWVEIDIVAGESRTPEYLARNPAGQVPCVELADGRVLSQSNAIICYLARNADSSLLPTDSYARAKLDEWLFWEQYSHEPFIGARRFQKTYLGKSDDEIDPKLLVKGREALQRLELQLDETDYLLGARFTIADIALVAYTRVAGEGGFDLSKFPAVNAWIARVERTLDIAPVAGAELDS